MTHEEKAELILETLAINSMNINWNLAVYYLKDIKKALREIEKLEIEKSLDKNSPLCRASQNKTYLRRLYHDYNFK